MSAHIETLHHVLCFDCEVDEVYRWADEARDAMDAHNQTAHSSVRCPGCDLDPVGYAPHNGKGDCPPIHENRSTR